MLGWTRIKDQETGKYLNLNVLDLDCEIVCRRLNIPVRGLTDGSSWDWVSDKVRDLAKAFLKSAGVINGNYDETLLEILKKSTYVTKTRKVWGHHIYWLSREQRKAVGTVDCRDGFQFEIKTDDSLGLCTLPGSAHKEDPNFRYTAIGVTDRILPNDILYDLFIEMFKDCLKNGQLDNGTSGAENKKSKKDPSGNSGQQEKEKESRSVKIKNPVVLSDSTIKATAGQMSEFVEKNYRNEFYLRFSGMLFHARISEESASKIIARMCLITNDEESKSRQLTLTLTYEKGFNGEEIEGAPKLAELIATKVEGQDLVSATLLLDNIKVMWRLDKKIKRQKEESQLVKVSIAEAKKMQSGYVQVRGNIVGMSTIYQMVKSTRRSCDDCGYDEETVYDIPQFRAHVKDRSKCPQYTKDHSGTDTAVAEYEYTPTVDIWLQDMEKAGDLTRLQVKLFENNTYDVNTGEIVDVIGHIQPK